MGAKCPANLPARAAAPVAWGCPSAEASRGPRHPGGPANPPAQELTEVLRQHAANLCVADSDLAVARELVRRARLAERLALRPLDASPPRGVAWSGALGECGDLGRLRRV